MMTSFACLLLIIAAGVSRSASQGLPPSPCNRPPPGVLDLHKCCKVSSYFTDEDYESCGINWQVELANRRGPPPDCSKIKCVLKKYNLLNEDETINLDAVGAFLDKYSDANPEFQPAVKKTKERCVIKNIPGPLQVCDANKLMHCAVHTVMFNCPQFVENDDSCKALKDHIEECKKYF